MKSTTESLSPTRVRLSIEVPFEEFQPSLDAAYKKIGSQIRIPGFRPGKVPARIIDQRVGRDAVIQEAVNEVVPHKYLEAVREHELQTLGQPELEITQLGDEAGETVNFTAEVDVRPEIEVPDLDDITVQVDDADVTDADVNDQLDGLRDRFGSLSGVDRAVESGDYVSLDLEASVDGEVVEAGSAKGMSYEVGSGDLIDGLDDAIVGASAGDTVVFQATLQQGDASGQDAAIKATVNSVKVKELPELDDEFAQLASEFDTIDELRDDLRRRLGSVKKLEQGAQARDKLLEQLVDAVEFPLPESAVKTEVEFREHEVIHSLNHDDAMFERYLEMQGKSRDEFTAELRAAAETSVRAQFVLDAIADKTEVNVADAELTEYLVRQAQRYEMSPRDFANQVMEAGNLPALVADVRRNKALGELLEQARITDASGNPVDLSALSAEALADLAAAEGEDEPGEDTGAPTDEGEAGSSSDTEPPAAE